MKTIVMAEIGENHYGRWDVCRGMVEEAAANGATIAKFQTYTASQFGKDHECSRVWNARGGTLPDAGTLR